QQRLKAEENERIAREQEAEAKKQRELAEKNEKLAKDNEAEAIEQRRQAELHAEKELRQRYIAQAKAMALKSVELSNDLELEGLMAQQAYLFNTKYGGEAYDNDIYNGLFFALRNNEHPLTNSLAGHDYGNARTMVT